MWVLQNFIESYKCATLLKRKLLALRIKKSNCQLVKRNLWHREQTKRRNSIKSATYLDGKNEQTVLHWLDLVTARCYHVRPGPRPQSPTHQHYGATEKPLDVGSEGYGMFPSQLLSPGLEYRHEPPCHTLGLDRTKMDGCFILRNVGFGTPKLSSSLDNFFKCLIRRCSGKIKQDTILQLIAKLFDGKMYYECFTFWTSPSGQSCNQLSELKLVRLRDDYALYVHRNWFCKERELVFHVYCFFSKLSLINSSPNANERHFRNQVRRNEQIIRRSYVI